jgi:hypothetical protein
VHFSEKQPLFRGLKSQPASILAGAHGIAASRGSPIHP